MYHLEDSNETDSGQSLIPPLAQCSSTDMLECIISQDTQQELVCSGYKRSTFKTSLCYLAIVCTGGFLLLIYYWRPDWKLKCTHSPCPLKVADAVHLATTDDTKQVFVSVMQTMSEELAHLISRRYPPKPSNAANGVLEAEPSYGTAYGRKDSVMYFVHHDFKFFWDPKVQTFVQLGGLDQQVTLEQIHQDSSSGLNKDDLASRQALFGQNVITVKIPSYIELLITEILNPFYIFQLFAVIFWSFDEYYIYASAIFVVSIISAVMSLIQVRKERVRLHDMVEYHNETKTKVFRQNNAEPEVHEVWSKELVPGDVIVIPPSGMLLGFDAALVSGTCIVNESMLTGESVPVTKTPLPSNESELPQTYNIDFQKRHTLFCGTQVVQTRYYPGEAVKAVVVRTGYHTAKGSLVHSILYPKPMDMKLLQDAYRFVGVLFLIAMSGFIYTVVIQSLAGVSASQIALNAVDLITISVPPALPLAMTIGIVYAQLRLKTRKIHCISPQRINISGQVDIVAFDKTGTLTEDGLDLSVVIPANHRSPGMDSSRFLNPVQPETFQSDLGLSHQITHCMATCHTLTIINQEINGDPLDLKMFEATQWQLFEPKIEDESKYDQLQTTYVRPSPSLLDGEPTLVDSMNLSDPSPSDNENSTSSYDIGIVRQFPFSSSLQRASVIVKPYRSQGRDMVVYMKGAPEKVAKLCRPESLPSDFHDTLKSYTEKGFRMIGMAYKNLKTSWLKAQKIERSSVECDLTFLGLVAMQNKLKPQSSSALEKLHQANIRTLMVTGDNILTSLSVARESGMIGAHDLVLLAHTTPPTSTEPAQLRWQPAENSASCSSLSNSKESSPFSSGDEKAFKRMKKVAIELEETVSSSWHLAVSGHDYSIIEEYFQEWMEVLAVKGTIFARMSPDQKTSLMENLQSVDYHVCMCGDGANDCGALKRAHAGLSLSEYEASVAAPFTSHTDLGIECVPTLIREGRAALVTSFGVFKFMALYSVIQFCSITILYNVLSNLSDFEYLYIDLIIIDVVALTMSRNHAHSKLHHKRPASSLVSAEVLTSLICQILFQLGAQLAAFFLVQEQCWYTSLTPAQAKNQTYGNATICPSLNHVEDQSQLENDDNLLTYEGATIFYLSCFLYMSVSVAFSRGKPFRTSIYKNKFFIISLILLIGFTIFLMFFAPLDVDNFFEVRPIPDQIFLAILVAIAGGHFLLSVSFEMMVVENSDLWDSIRRSCSCFLRKHVSKRYKVVLGFLQPNCDPIVSSDVAGGDPYQYFVSVADKPPNPFQVVGQTLRSNVKDDRKSFVSIKTGF